MKFRSSILTLVICIVAVFGIFYSYVAYQKAFNDGLNLLQDRAETIAASLDADNITVLQGDQSDIGTPEYELLKYRLTDIRKVNADTRFAYVIGRRMNDAGKGEIFFYADSEDPTSPDYSPPGEIYVDESPAFNSAFDKHISGTEGPLRDQWGLWMTGVAPIFDTNGNEVAVVGLDIDAHQYITTAVKSALVYFLLTLIVVIVFILERIVSRRQRKLLDIKEQFVTIASHEIRSPLNGIMWMMNSLRKSVEGMPEAKATADNIYGHTQKLNETVHNILDVYSVKKSNLDSDPINLTTVVNEAVESMSMVASSRSQQVILDNFPVHLPMKGDHVALMRVFSNLISNAIKYSPEKATIRLAYVHDKNTHVITIADQGIGIPAGETEHVFDGFYRATNASKSSVEGSGIGLWLVRQTVVAHRGTIDVSSVVGKGTTFTLRFPAIL